MQPAPRERAWRAACRWVAALWEARLVGRWSWPCRERGGSASRYICCPMHGRHAISDYGFMSGPRADRGASRLRADRGVRAPGAPPVCPAGWHTGPPDFVGLGAQRAGTTRWFDLIVQHPEVEAPSVTRKELHYFDRFHSGGFATTDAVAYHDYFPRPRGRLTGEWTPFYLAAPWVPAMLSAAAPGDQAAREPAHTTRSSAIFRACNITAARPAPRLLRSMRRHRSMPSCAGSITAS